MKPTIWALPAVGGRARISSSHGLKRKKDPDPQPSSTPHSLLSCRTQLGPRPSVRGPRPPAAGNTRRNGPASRGKPTRLHRGLGMLRSPKLQVRSLLASSAAARAGAAGCRLDPSWESWSGQAASPGSLARGRKSGIGCGAHTLPCPGFRSAAGGSARGKNSGGCHDSRASESRGGGGGPASGSRATVSDPSLAGRA